MQAYGYDGAGNRLTVADPSGGVWTYAYDALKRQSNVQWPAAYRATQQYDSAGRKTTLILADGTTTTISYDGLNRIIGMRQVVATGAEINLIQDTYDAAGQKVRQTKSGYADRAWGYDGSGRIVTQVMTGFGATFVSDAGGNILVRALYP